MLIIVIASSAQSETKKLQPPEERRVVRPGPAPRPTRSQDRRETAHLRDAFLRVRLWQASDERTVLPPRANFSPSEDYTEVFLSHARVYVFAEKYDIQPLKRLALKVLHETLSVFFMWPGCVDDIVPLFGFAYNETFEPDFGVEPMKYMLHLYMCVEMSLLSGSKAFQDALDENRDMLEDYCDAVRSITSTK